ncbi:BTAD domain-containing putative transcriptional regulator [Plantactinospora mayteni]|nr:BTAD domain-containing putative transcriptional regulator [Plantactinospora mayteni]
MQILGPLRLWRNGVELHPGPRQQAYLLAVLLAHAGRPVSTSELIDLVWADDAPASAVNILQKYVGALRRLLEPGLSTRSAGSYLARRGDGYLLTADPGMLDLVTFRTLVETARTCLLDRQRDRALDCYAQALGLWRGSAGDGLAHGLAAMPVFTALDGEFFDACVSAAPLAVSLGRPERVLQALRLAAWMAPLHETVQAALVTVLGATGQRAEALSVFRATRARLAEELGVVPGAALETAHRSVLNQQATPVGAARRKPVAVSETPLGALVGRVGTIAVLRQTVELAFTGGTGLALVEGEPGIGKTRVLEELVGEAERRGALIAWGRCLPDDATPSMWPWMQAARALLGEMPPEWQADRLGVPVDTRGGEPAVPEVPDRGARFRLFERLAALIGRVAAARPVVLVFDDLQWADGASLEMFRHLAARLSAGTVVVGALRDRAPVPGPDLARMLAAASRLPDHRRIRLAPLRPADVAELVHLETGHRPEPAVARAVHARTGGNPFFVRELARFLTDGGPPAADGAVRCGVPSTVRDVVRARTDGLDPDSRDLLRIAALIGADVDLALLARAAGIDGQTCLDRIEPLEALGLLEPRDPYTVHFPHDLVRESVAAATPQRRVADLHLRIADALDRSDAGRLAHHLWAAGPLADLPRTVGALVHAGRRDAARRLMAGPGSVAGQCRVDGGDRAGYGTSGSATSAPYPATNASPPQPATGAPTRWPPPPPSRRGNGAGAVTAPKVHAATPGPRPPSLTPTPTDTTSGC